MREHFSLCFKLMWRMNKLAPLILLINLYRNNMHENHADFICVNASTSDRRTFLSCWWWLLCWRAPLPWTDRVGKHFMLEWCCWCSCGCCCCWCKRSTRSEPLTPQRWVASVVSESILAKHCRWTRVMRLKQREMQSRKTFLVEVRLPPKIHKKDPLVVE